MGNLAFSPLWISLKVSLLATGLSGVTGVLLAFWCIKTKAYRRRFILESFVLLPMVLPPTVTGYLILKTLGQNSPIGRILSVFNLQLIFTWQAAVIAAFIVSLPLVFKGTKSALEQLDPALIESARVLGANEFEILWWILLPAARKGISAALVLGFARALGEFGATMMVSGAILGKTMTVPMALYFAAVNGDNQTAFIWTALLFSMAMLLLWLSELPLKIMLKK